MSDNLENQEQDAPLSRREELAQHERDAAAIHAKTPQWVLDEIAAIEKHLGENSNG